MAPRGLIRLLTGVQLGVPRWVYCASVCPLRIHHGANMCVYDVHVLCGCDVCNLGQWRSHLEAAITQKWMDEVCQAGDVYLIFCLRAASMHQPRALLEYAWSLDVIWMRREQSGLKERPRGVNKHSKVVASSQHHAAGICVLWFTVYHMPAATRQVRT